jgi:PmbA protein
MQADALLTLAEHAVSAARAAGATSSDALAVFSSDVNASIRNGEPEAIERAESAGVGLRVFVGHACATLSSSDLTSASMRSMAEKAVAIARAAPADPHAALADATQLAKTFAALDIADDAVPEMNHLQTLARDAEAAGRSVAGITNSNGGDASASHHHLALVTSHGFSGNYSSSRYSISASLIAGSGDTMQRDYDYAMVTHFRDLPAAETIGAYAAERALHKLNPRKLPSQTATIYFEPRVGRSLLGAFASAISGSAITRGTSFLKDDLGKKIFAQNITVTDDPLRARGLGSRPFDAEGIAGTARNFIEHGVLTSWVLDTRSANQLGLKTTGHAARGLSGAPHPSTTNLHIQNGTASVSDLYTQLGDGFYVTETIGHGTNLITGDYSVGASGFWIENGKRAFAVSEVTIAGNLRDMFAALIPANDLQFRYGTNVPTLAVPNMTIAGNG